MKTFLYFLIAFGFLVSCDPVFAAGSGVPNHYAKFKGLASLTSGLLIDDGTNLILGSGNLDLSTDTTGTIIVAPMTTTQRNALTPANGMMIYNTTTSSFQKYEAGAWVDWVGAGSVSYPLLAPAGTSSAPSYGFTTCGGVTPGTCGLRTDPSSGTGVVLQYDLNNYISAQIDAAELVSVNIARNSSSYIIVLGSGGVIRNGENDTFPLSWGTSGGGIGNLDIISTLITHNIPTLFKGTVTFSPDNTYDIGANASTRPRRLYLGTGLFGTTTNNNAVTGDVGEYITATIATGASISLSTGTTATVTSISLTAGDWDVSGVVDYTFGATTNYTNLVQGISTTAATLGSQDTFTDYETAATVPTATADASWNTPLTRISIASTTTVYLVSQATFTISTLKAYGTIRARRIR